MFNQIWAQSLETEMDSVMNGYIDSGKLHGCVTYVQKDGKILLNKAYGFQNIGQQAKLESDAVFNIASLAKVVTAAGALKLYEQGEFLLDDPLDKYLPELNDLKVIENIGTDSSKLVNPLRKITIRDIFRHTAGFSYVQKFEDAKNTVDSAYVFHEVGLCKTSGEFLERLSKIPLKYHPGANGNTVILLISWGS